MLVESDPHETRVAVLEDDRLTELLVERVRERGLVGNVYKGRVTRVLPGMQAAFVNIGLERDAFLYVSDVGGSEQDAGLPLDEDELSDDQEAAKDPAPSSDSSSEGSDTEGSDTESGDSEGGEAGVSEEAQEASSLSHQRNAERQELPAIDELLRPGQELVVQVAKDPLPNKGARITAHVTLPGRYLVLLPTVRHIGISRRIEEPQERERLHEVLSSMSLETGGMIVRTVGEGKGHSEFEADRVYLSRLWSGITRRAESVYAPTLLHQESDASLRMVRDVFSGDFDVLLVEGEDTYERIVHFLDQVQPKLLPKVKLHSSGKPLFDRFRIHDEMDAALKSRVWLKSGGYIVIHQTEALVAIDVNTGRFTGGQDLEDTVVKTNLEAIREVVRQIRLRDLGGIIVLDLIDMVEEVHRQEVFAALERELQKDRAKNRVLSISEFGLVELTRKRTRPSLDRLLTQSCPYCRGRGRIRSITTTCLALRREALEHGAISPGAQLLLRVHPEVARALHSEEEAILRELRERLGKAVVVQSDPDLHHERFDVSEL